MQLACTQSLDRIGDRRRAYAVLHDHRSLSAGKADLIERDSVVRAHPADDPNEARGHDFDVLALGQSHALKYVGRPYEDPLARPIESNHHPPPPVLECLDRAEGLPAGLAPADKVLGYERLGHVS